MQGNIDSFHILLAYDECAVNISYSYAFSHDCNMITAGWEGVTFLGACAREVRERGTGETGGVKDSGLHVCKWHCYDRPSLPAALI